MLTGPLRSDQEGREATLTDLFAVVAFVVERAPSGARCGCRAVACTTGSSWGDPAQPLAVLRASIALIAARRLVPSDAGPCAGDCEGLRPAATWRRDQASGCRFGVVKDPWRRSAFRRPALKGCGPAKLRGNTDVSL